MVKEVQKPAERGMRQGNQWLQQRQWLSNCCSATFRSTEPN